MKLYPENIKHLLLNPLKRKTSLSLIYHSEFNAKQKRHPKTDASKALTIKLRLTLNTTGCNAFNVVTLHKEEQDGDRNSNDNGTCEEALEVSCLEIK